LAGKTAASSEPDILTKQIGTTIGRYKLLQQIGEGGFGVVFMAEQTEPVQRKVALKVIKAGMDTREVIARFEAERQALALMDHPNIAKVLDAGSTERPLTPPLSPSGGEGARRAGEGDTGHPLPSDGRGAGGEGTPYLSAGRPYFVMELVRGLPITQYCDQASLCTRERLELFIKVCRAVQHAHQKGIIHRDLKPSNVLVTLHDGEPVPKVIDFGVAKALGQKLTDKTLFTRFEQMIGTPAYMSPEQAALSGLDIDTRSDIYSLGVLLYELLTGVMPFDSETFRRAGLDEIRRIIQETEPPKPSTRLTDLVAADARRLTLKSEIRNPKSEIDRASVRRLLQHKKELISAVRGDLDWITMKALEKNRERRYDAANGLAADLERHLNHEPVLARPPSALYRLGRAMRRHRGAFAAVAAVAVALVLGVIISALQAVRATRAEREQSRQRQRADEELWKSYLAQARAYRWSGRAGRRFDSLDLLKKAAEFRTSIELRNEAIACMTLPDLRVARQWQINGSGKVSMAFDAPLERYAKMDATQNAISVHRTRDDAELMRFSGFTLPRLDVRFSPNGQYLAVACGSQLPELRVWDLNRNEVKLQPAEFRFRCMDFSPDDRSLAVAHREGGPIVIYDLASGSEMKTLPQGPLPWTVAFDPAGRGLAVSSDRDSRVEIRDVETGTVIQSLPHSDPVKEVSWHPNGRFLATACMDHNVHIWDTTTGTIRTTLKGHEAPVTHVHFDHAGDLLASDGWDATWRLWDFWTGRQIITMVNLDAKFTLDDHWMAGVASDQTPTIWEVAKGRECWTLHCEQESEKGPSSVDFSPDGRLLASAHSIGVRLWDLAGFREIALFGDKVCFAVAFHPNSRSVITAGRTGLKQWPIEFHQNGLSNRVRVGPALSFGSPMEFGYIAMSPGGNTLAAIGNRVVHVFDMQTRQERHRLRGPQRGWSASFSPNGSWLAAGPFGRDDVMVWNLQNGELERKLPLNDSAHVAFSPDNKWLVTATSREYRFWEVGSWQPAHSIARRGASDHAGTLCFTADGKILAIAEGRSLVRLLDPDTCHEWATLEAPFPSEITRLRFNSDGTQLAAATKNIQLWDLGLIRQQLAAMKLDWELPALPPPSQKPAAPLTVTVLGSTNEPDAKPLQRHLDRAETYERQAQYDKALAEYEKALELKPNSARANNNLAWAYANRPKDFRSPEKALPLALKAVELSKTNHNELNTLGVVYYRLGQLTNAIETLEAGIKANRAGGSSHDFFFLAMSYQRLGDPTKARDYFTKATNWVAAQSTLPPTWQVELDAFRAEAEEVLGKPKAE
jgi:serine/threonine protein kinase/WD40 repeat protein/Tfp pilus assembly protein PilF